MDEISGRIIEVGDLNLQASLDDVVQKAPESRPSGAASKLVTFEEPAPLVDEIPAVDREDTYERSGPLLVGNPKGEIVEKSDQPKIETCIFSLEQICDLTSWRDAKKSAVLFTPAFFLLAAACFLPILSVFFYSLFFSIVFSITLRLLLLVRHYLTKSDQSDIESCLQNVNVKIDQTALHNLVGTAVDRWNENAGALHDLFTAKSVKRSLSAGFLFWLAACLTRYVSTPALLLLTWTSLFTLPKFYQVYKAPIDKNFAILKAKLSKTRDLINEKVAGSKKTN